MSTARIPYIDTAKGIAMICIVLGHMNRIPEVSSYLGSFNLMLFIFISGLFLNPNKYAGFAPYAISKIRSLYIPYLILSAVIFAYWFFVEKDMRGLCIPWQDAALGILWGSDCCYWIYPGGALWFLPAIFSAELMAYPVLRYCNRPGTLIATAGLFGLGILFTEAAKNSLLPALCLPLGMNSAFLMIPFLVGGFLMKERILTPKKESVSKTFILLLALILIAINIAISPFLDSGLCIAKPNNWLYYALFPWVGIASWLLIAKLIGSCSWLEYIGKNTLPILAFHQPLLRIARYMAAKCFNLDANCIQHDYRFCIGIVIITLIACIPAIVVWRFIYPRLLKVLRF